MSEYLVELREVTKYFPGVIALKKMSIGIKSGEIHGLIGENGAGKSTIIKTFTGINKPDEGGIYVEGEKVNFKTPIDAIKAGIGCVYQELNIVNELSITDNIFIGNYLKKPTGLLDYARMNKKAKQMMLDLGQDLDVTKPCSDFSLGIRQMVEIAKAMLNESKLLIMDEPSSSLGENEIKQLMKTCKALKAKGIAILFVSHKLEEIFEVCDVVTVMRDGEHISTTPTTQMTNDSLIADMVGRSLDNLFPKEIGVKGEEFLRTENFTRFGEFSGIDFTAYGGQVLGFAGLVGAGRSELFSGIFGARDLDAGTCYIKGEKVVINSPKEAIAHKIAFVTEDRKGNGLVLNESVLQNLSLAILTKTRTAGMFVNTPVLKEMATKNIESLKIKTPNDATPVGTLSGGNQQKVVIGKWVNTEADIFIFDEPTRGIDVGAKIEVYNVMNRLVKEGKCVIMISSELPEILGMSDRVIVMREGKKMAEIERDSKYFNSQDIMTAAWGGILA